MDTELGKTAAQIRRERLEKDPAFRDRWERTALARAAANAVIRYRAERGWAQTRLAKELGMSQPQIARIESGEHTPSFETLQRISRVTGLRFIVDVSPTSVHEELSLPGGAKVLDRITTSTVEILLLAAG